MEMNKINEMNKILKGQNFIKIKIIRAQPSLIHSRLDAAQVPDSLCFQQGSSTGMQLYYAYTKLSLGRQTAED